jgi:tetratricopeptide (TPR) repeat protein
MTNISKVYEQAVSQHRSGNLQEAESLYKKILEQDPNHSDALNLLGLACYKMNRHNEALNFINRAVSLNSKNPAYHFNLGNVYGAAALLEDAVRSFKLAISLNPNYADAYVGLGNTYRAANKLENAEASYKKALAVRSDNYEAYSELARVYLAQGKWAELENCCQAALQLKPNYAAIYRTLGNANVAQGKTEAAIAAYQRALQIDPKLAEAYWDMSLAMNLLVMDYQHRALELKPDLAGISTHMHLGNAFLAKGKDKLDTAVASFQRVTRIAPNFVDAYCDLATALSRRGDLEAAVEAIQTAIDISPDFPKARVSLGSILEQQGKEAEALVAFQQALELDPNNAEANYSLGKLLMHQGRPDEAISCVQKALRVNPNFADAYYQLAYIYLTKRDNEQALENCQKALALTPQSPDVINMYGNILLTGGSPDQAIEAYEAALKIDPNLLLTNYFLGRGHQVKGNFVEAGKFFDRALAIQPDYVGAIAGKAGILEKSREFQAAYDLLHPILESDASNEMALNLFSEVSRRLGRQQEAIDLIEGRLSKGNLRLDQHRLLLFNLGNLYDEIGAFDDAFRCIQLGNTLETNRFNIETCQQEFDRLIQIFSADNLAILPRANNNSELPVFIVGMPRSGTTLVEQILASYPQVFAAGELTDITRITYNLPARLCVDTPYPECIESVTSDLLSTLAEEQIYRLRQFSATATRTIDKLPHNFLQLGLIALLFPKARIIHCLRHPLDTCLSCYFQDFMGSHPYKFNLEHLGSYYKQYERLMAHWKDVLDIPILDVQYEDMVAEQETMSRKIVDFLGLEWDEACLNFYKSKRFARTASYDQVRQPIYNKSVARYKNYEKHLGQLKLALGMD